MVILFGGSFDPIHLGHIDFVKRLLEKFSPHRILLVPVHKNPLRPKGPVASSSDRIEMIRIALKDLANPIVEVVDWEIQRPAPSYTLQTIEKAQSIFPKQRLAVAVGNEVFVALPRWYKPKELLSKVDWMVCTRTGRFDAENLQYTLKNSGAENLQTSLEEKKISYMVDGVSHALHVVEFDPLSTSSTEIREAFSKNPQACPSGLNTHVTLYIKQQRLYSVKSLG